MASEVCRNGHEKTPEHTYVYPSGHRRCRECKREADRRYEASDKGRETVRRYEASDEGREKHRRWRASDKGRETVRRYEASDKGRERSERYLGSPKGQLVKLLVGVRDNAKRRGTR